MSDKKKFIVENMKGRRRPQLTCDNLGYPPEVGDEEWEKKHKKNYTRLPNGKWERKN